MSIAHVIDKHNGTFQIEISDPDKRSRCIIAHALTDWFAEVVDDLSENSAKRVKGKKVVLSGVPSADAAAEIIERYQGAENDRIKITNLEEVGLELSGIGATAYQKRS